MKNKIAATLSLNAAQVLALTVSAGWLAACTLTPTSAPVLPAQAPTVQVKLIAFNDFHGNLMPPGMRLPIPDASQPNGVRLEAAGGIEAFSATVAKLKAENKLNAVVSAGDMVGATPLLSALFHDEPTIEAMNLVGIDFHAVGNHEFDRGIAHLKHLKNGGCEPDEKTGKADCSGRPPFTGAAFPFLAANVVEEATGKTLFPPYGVKAFDGIKVAFIGLTLHETPEIVRPGGTKGVRFLEEAQTINALVPEIRKQGIEAIVVLIHEGGSQSGGINDCTDFKGAIKPIVERFDPAIQVIVTAHTHRFHICELGGRLVTSAGSFGGLITDIDLTLDRASGKIIAKHAKNLLVAADGPKDARLTPLLDQYTRLSAPLEGRVIAKFTRPISRRERSAAESELGNFVVDAQLFGTAPADKGGAQIAFNNQTSLRSAITPDANGNVSYGALFKVQPFQNDLVVMTLTGAQIKRALEHQLGLEGPPTDRTLLDVSAGFSYTYDAARPAGQRVLAETMSLNGKPIVATEKYRVVVNSFLAGGSEGHSIFSEGTERVVSVLDLDAVITYLEAHNPYTPPPLGSRVRRIN